MSILSSTNTGKVGFEKKKEELQQIEEKVNQLIKQ